MRYFVDTEFIEDGKTIDLISIGIVAEDGREYYAISKEFDASRADEWVKVNVLAQLPETKTSVRPMGPFLRGMYIDYHYPPEYKTREEIKAGILEFVNEDEPEFWANYAAYDWVVLCQLFGKMIDLPKGWPYFCRDIQQLAQSLGNLELPKQEQGEHNALEDAKWGKVAYDFLTTA